MKRSKEKKERGRRGRGGVEGGGRNTSFSPSRENMGHRNIHAHTERAREEERKRECLCDREKDTRRLSES